MLFAATNEVPEHGELAALKDRFVLKAESRPVQDDHFEELIDAGVRGEADRTLNRKPWIEEHCSLDDLLKAGRYLMLQMARGGDGSATDDAPDRETFFPARGLPRVSAAGENSRPRGSSLRERSQAGSSTSSCASAPGSSRAASSGSTTFGSSHTLAEPFPRCVCCAEKVPALLGDA